MSMDGSEPGCTSSEAPFIRALALATAAFLLFGVFDVGRALYCRVRLQWAVSHLATQTSEPGLMAAALDEGTNAASLARRVRRLSGIRDLAATDVRLWRSPPSAGKHGGSAVPAAVRVSVTHAVPLLSPYALLAFPRGEIEVGAAETYRLLNAPASFD